MKYTHEQIMKMAEYYEMKDPRGAEVAEVLRYLSRAVSDDHLHLTYMCGYHDALAKFDGPKRALRGNADELIK